MDNNADVLTTAVRHLRYASYTDVSSLALLTYDYILTFGDETSLMWKPPWSPTKIMFFLTRCLPFVDTSIIIWQASARGLSERSCAFAYEATFWMLGIGICSAEVILAVRTWAVYGFSRRIGLFLAVSGCLTMVPALVLGGISVHSLHYAPLPSNLPGCLIISAGKSYVTHSWALLAAFEGIVLVLMLHKAFRVYKVQGHTYIYKRVYADGSLFYVYLFVLSIANLIVVLRRPLGLSNLLSSIERVIHSILTARILIDLNRIGTHSWKDDTSDELLDTFVVYRESNSSLGE